MTTLRRCPETGDWTFDLPAPGRRRRVYTARLAGSAADSEDTARGYADGVLADPQAFYAAARPEWREEGRK